MLTFLLLSFVYLKTFLFIGMYFIRKNIPGSKLSINRTIDFEQIRICVEKYPNVFVLMAAAGTTEDGYPKTSQCDKNRHNIYSLGRRGKNLLMVLPTCQQYNDSSLYQVSGSYMFLSFHSWKMLSSYVFLSLSGIYWFSETVWVKQTWI